MSENFNPNERLTDEQKRTLFDQEMVPSVKLLGIKPELLRANISFGPKSNKTPSEEFELAKAMGLKLVVDKLRDDFMAKVHTAEDFENFRKTFNEGRPRIPTLARKLLQSIKLGLPRLGGPGRDHKLTAEEQAVAVKCMSEMMRRKDAKDVKQAAGILSGQSEERFGKKISLRTFQNYWRDRPEIRENE
jgi:hypothetical protein